MLLAFRRAQGNHFCGLLPQPLSPSFQNGWVNGDIYSKIFPDCFQTLID